MTVRSLVGSVVTAAVLILVLCAIAGAVLGQPVALGFVETGSMAPTLSPGDGFVAVPAALAGPIERGDVVTFDADRIHGGGLVTHRVVGETERGFVTKGDANAFTDQAGEEPPVKRAQVAAVAFEFRGGVVAVPGIGAIVGGLRDALATLQRWLASTLGIPAVLGVRGLAYLFFAGSLVVYAVEEYRDRGRRHRDRSRDTGWNPRPVLLAFAAVIVLAATAAMVLPGGATEFGVVSAEFDSEGARVIPTGESETTTFRVPNGGLLPVVSVLEPGSEGISVSPREFRVAPGAAEEATVTLSAPDETGHYRRFLVEHRYLAVLPTDVILSLYRVHPWLPILAIDALLGVPVYLVGSTVVGSGRLRDRGSAGAGGGTPSRARDYVPGLRRGRQR